ncbi:hypothetical protein [Flavobacterium sp. HJJ]|nr:hypothetical protein [Flavobacterium sp. HJJ]MBF4470925.1 hypothetical protein [Flavobacterium sp. HJJ]
MIAKIVRREQFIEVLGGLLPKDQGQGYEKEVFTKKMKKEKNKTRKMVIP